MKKRWGKYVLGVGLYFLVLVNGIWGTKKLSSLEIVKREMAKNPNNIQARLEWWKNLAEMRYWEEARKEEVYFDSMYKALDKKDQEKVAEIKDFLKRKYPVYLLEELKKIENEGQKNKDWWIKKAEMEMELEEYDKAREAIQEARKIDKVDEELEKMERELDNMSSKTS